MNPNAHSSSVGNFVNGSNQKNAVTASPNPPVKTESSVLSSVSGKERIIGIGEPLFRERDKIGEVNPEVKQAGVVKKTENIEIPPDLQNLGIKTIGTAVAVPAKTTLKLPISDEKIEAGLNMNILSSLRWLSEWCLYRLKRFHLTLKVIHGKVTRIRSK